MNRKLYQMLTPRSGIYFLVLVLFSVVTYLLGFREVALVELAVSVVVAVVYLVTMSGKKRTAGEYLGQLLGSMDGATRESVLNCPLPVVMFCPDRDEVVWSNERFLKVVGSHDSVFDTKMSELVPQLPTRWLLEGKNECPGEVVVRERRYQVFGGMSYSAGQAEGAMATVYWMDVTELANTRDIYKATRPVVAILLLDNYEDTLKGQDDSVQSAMLSEISQRLTQWVASSNGVFCKLDRDRYLFVFEEQYLAGYKADKFSVLDSVRTVLSPGGIPVTLSIGMGVDGESFDELFRFATLSAEMALSRGGDQVVVKNRFGFEFYGGRTKETEKRTKVKSRVMASALGELVADASCVMTMGHAAADMDAVGAAVGVCAIARKKGVPYYIIRENGPVPADDLYARLEGMEEYKNVFLDSQEALLKADANTLLVVVDTNRPEQVASREVLASCNKVAVIDHHRRAASYIEGAALNFQEPYASSACELVTELIGYIMEAGDLLRGEAEALMAGVMLDTKNFTLRTGGRTFEAAAFLRRAGGDTSAVRKLFEIDLATTVARYDIIRNSRMYREGIAIAPVDHTVGRVTAAQAADELLTIAGISTSFVIFPEGEQVILSARSISQVNVQIIAEALGGGGNGEAAGAQIPGQSVEEVTQRLIEALDRYFDHNEEDEDQEI